MIDTISNPFSFSMIWNYIGPLVIGGFGYLITNKVWDRQRQWELKRDQVYEALKLAAAFENDLRSVYLCHPKDEPTMSELKKRFEPDTKFYSVMFLTDVVVGKELGDSLLAFVNEIRRVAMDIMAGKPDSYDSEHMKLLQLKNAVKLAARKELNIKKKSWFCFWAN
jgi:hypothetical protein